MRYLVTGGAGFIGSAIAEALLARGDAVTVLDNLSSGRESNLERLKGDVVFERGDVRDAKARAKALTGVAGVFHEAAVASVGASIADPITCDDVNTRGTLALLEDARAAGIKRFVFAASAAAYGDGPTLPKVETMAPAPLSPYAASKLAGEHYVRSYAHLHGMRTASLRYFNVFGVHQDPNGEYAAVVPKFVDALLAGKAPTVFGDGEQTR
ncbi:MAG: SDR family NAD(P)-dependent oxidoreductase, partial [Myxococcales bacterium]|nr:SDR family NAD(P)-dependent oxidoreductase [Myxococcales bacterium]